MAKTLLAVDDSVTMRKVLEITFSGEDFNVLTAEGQNDALAKLSGDANVVVIDTALGEGDGYALCKEVRKRNPAATLILLSSRHNAYDAAKGKDAGADDYADKPFDTQALIDKVKKAVAVREGGAPVAAAAPAPAAAAAKPAAAVPVAKPLDQRGTQPSLGGQAAGARQRSATLMFGHEPSGELKPVDNPVPAPAKPEPARIPTPMPATTSPSTVAATPAALHVNGALAGKLEGLGLTAQQTEAVLALSREVVERVVWEVVPVLAETLIKEEIARLTKEA